MILLIMLDMPQGILGYINILRNVYLNYVYIKSFYPNCSQFKYKTCYFWKIFNTSCMNDNIICSYHNNSVFVHWMIIKCFNINRIIFLSTDTTKKYKCLRTLHVNTSPIKFNGTKFENFFSISLISHSCLFNLH